MQKMERTGNEVCQSCGQNTDGLSVLPCCHSNCYECVEKHRKDDTLSCGRCRNKYTILTDSENACVDQRTENFPILQVSSSTDGASNNIEVWCCFCGDYITNCDHKSYETMYASARSSLTEEGFSRDNQTLCRGQNSNSSEDFEVLATPGSSLDFDSLLGSIEDSNDCSDFYSSAKLDKCPEHDFPSTNYCFSHAIVCCAECTQLHHKNCNTKDIREAAMEIPSESEVQSLRQNISSSIDMQESLIQEMERNDVEISEQKKEIWETLKDIKAALLRKFSQLEDIVQKDMEDVEYKRKSLRTEIGNFRERYNVLQCASNQIKEEFVKSPECLKRYCQLKAQLREHKDFFRTQRQHVSKFRMVITKREDLDEFLFKIPDLLRVSHEKVKPETMKKLKCQERLAVRRWTHTKLPRITGMCYLGDTLVICDHVKERLFTYSSQQVWQCIRLGQPPWDVTVIEKQKIAVSTSSPSGIQIIDLEYYPNKELGFPRFLPTDFDCYGLEYFDGNFYIASETHVRILSVDGSNLRSLKCPGLSVRYLCMYGADNIYISDTNSNTVSCMDSKGKIRMTFGSNILDSPKGLAIGPSTNVIVVSAALSSVLRFTSDGLQVETSELKNKDKHMPTPKPEAVCCYSDACAIAAGQMIYKCHFD